MGYSTKFLAKLLCASVLFFGVVGTANADLALQFTRDIGTPTGLTGYAAVGFDGTNFCVARWNSALSTDISRITPAGALVDTFQIAGLSGTRSLTWDGTQFWAGNATTTLRRVDPVTKTVTATVTVPIAARYVTYDPTANSGAGGFWIGNFDTDIVQVSMTGATLATIPAATTAAMGGRYGIAFDNVSGPTPFLWVFYQTGGPSTASLGIIDLPSGMPRAQVQNNCHAGARPGLPRGWCIPDRWRHGPTSHAAVACPRYARHDCRLDPGAKRASGTDEVQHRLTVAQHELRQR